MDSAQFAEAMDALRRLMPKPPPPAGSDAASAHVSAATALKEARRLLDPLLLKERPETATSCLVTRYCRNVPTRTDRGGHPLACQAFRFGVTGFNVLATDLGFREEDPIKFVYVTV